LSHIQKASSVIMTLCGVKMFNPPSDNWWSRLDERQNIFKKWITKSRWSSNDFPPWYSVFSCISGKSDSANNCPRYLSCDQIHG